MSSKPLARSFAALGVVVATTMGAGAASAAPASQGSTNGTVSAGATAKYGIKSLNLAQSWGTAKSCVVFSGGATECFDSNKAADASLIRRGLATAESFASEPGAGMIAIPACASRYLCLWENSSGGGRRLIFQDENEQWLGNWGFDRKVSSYRNRQLDGSGWLRSTHFADSLHYKLENDGYASYIGDMWNDLADYVHP